MFWKVNLIPIVIPLIGLAYGGPVHNSGGSLNSLYPHHSKSKESHSQGFAYPRGISAKKYFKCSGHGLQPSKDNCRTFYHCVDLREYGLHWMAFRFTCPEGMFFDSRANDCFWLDRQNLGHAKCTPALIAEEGIKLYLSGKLEDNAAVVVNSDMGTNSCEHIAEETSLLSTSVSGYKSDVEFLLKEMPEICHAVANVSNSLHEIKAKQFFIVPPSETIIFRNVSLEYNEDLLLIQRTVDALMGKEGILKSLNEILSLVRDFEISFRSKLSAIKKPSDSLSNAIPFLKNIEEEIKEMSEVTEHIKTCLNFSVYGYASQAVVTFFVNDHGEVQDHQNDSNKKEIEDHILGPLEGFFQYVNDTSGVIIIKTQNLQAKISEFLEDIWKSYAEFRNYRIIAVGGLRHLHDEKLQSLEEIDKTKAGMLKISDELQSKLAFLSSVPESHKRSGSFFAFDRATSIRALVNTFHDIWNIIKTREYPITHRIERLRSSEQIKNHKEQVIQMNVELKRLNERILMLEGDIPLLEEEMLRMRELEIESKKILNDSYWLVSGVIKIMSVLREIENIFTTVIREAQKDISRSRMYRFGRLHKITRLHLYMAIENLKWNWRHVSRYMITIERCGAHK
ncbi:uncharacterized protein [Palaemon carinicauda]|uniref:uncharacterized protein n=1 Tax=Palaemon carinicauda TaxID=392227 RepID=UPI0035B67D3C